MDSILQALRETTPYGRAAKIADQIGMSRGMLSNKINPDNEHHHLNVIEMVRLIEATGDLRPIYAIADKLGLRVLPKDTAHQNADVLALLLKATSEQGDVARVISDVISDGKILPREANLSIKEIGEAIDALVSLREGILSQCREVKA